MLLFSLEQNYKNDSIQNRNFSILSVFDSLFWEINVE